MNKLMLPLLLASWMSQAIGDETLTNVLIPDGNGDWAICIGECMVPVTGGGPGIENTAEATIECRYAEKVDKGYRDGKVIEATCVEQEDVNWFLVLTTIDDSSFQNSDPPGVGMSVIPLPYPSLDDCNGAGEWWGAKFDPTRGFGNGNDYSFHCVPQTSD